MTRLFPARPASPRVVLGVVLLAVLAITVETTVVNVALPTLNTELGATTTQLQWIVDAYNLAFAALVLAGGGLGDRFGRRGVLVDAVCPGHCRTDMGGPDAPRSAEQGADTVLWLAQRDEGPTGLLWEDRAVVPW